MTSSGPYPSKYPQLDEMAFTPQAREVLIRIISVAFPHKDFPPGPYERMADKLITMADDSTWFRIKLIQGVETLNSFAGGKFTELDYGDAVKALKRVEKTEFFSFIRRTTVLEMYDDEEVWDVVGYEGPSFDKGGYINRGFNDLDWLPDPRILENPDEVLDGLPGRAAPGAATTSTVTSGKEN